MILPACSSATIFRLDVESSGGALLTAKFLDDSKSPSWSKKRRIEEAAVRRFERKISRQQVNHITPDRFALRHRQICYDGVTILYEIIVKNRYRYAYRHSCDIGFERLSATANAMTALTPDLKFDLSRC